jgi:hypothetical protein
MSMGTLIDCTLIGACDCFHWEPGRQLGSPSLRIGQLSCVCGHLGAVVLSFAGCVRRCASSMACRCVLSQLDGRQNARRSSHLPKLSRTVCYIRP